jgi:hypothetical protein
MFLANRPIVEDDHFDLNIGEGEGERSSEEMRSTEARDRGCSRPLAMLVSKLTLRLEA